MCLHITRLMAGSHAPEVFVDLMWSADDPVSNIRDVAIEGIFAIYESRQDDAETFNALCRAFDSPSFDVLAAALFHFDITLQRIAAALRIELIPIINDEDRWTTAQPAVAKIAPEQPIHSRADAIQVLKHYPRTRPRRD